MATIMAKAAKKGGKRGETIMQKASGVPKKYMFAEGVLGRYASGKLTAAQTQRELARQGLKADLRGIKGADAFVYPIEGSGGFYVEF
jgi:hypothetical protein